MHIQDTHQSEHSTDSSGAVRIYLIYSDMINNIQPQIFHQTCCKTLVVYGVGYSICIQISFLIFLVTPTVS